MDKIEQAKEIIKNICDAIPLKDDSGLGIISHPLASMATYFYKEKFYVLKTTSKNIEIEGNYEYVDEKTFRQFWWNQLTRDAKEVSQLLFRTNKPYWLTIFYYLKDLFEEKEYNEILAEIWIMVEFPHQEDTKILIELFEKSQKELLFDKEDYEKYKQMPEELTIYRGLQDKKSSVRALSWTLSKEKAKWFSNRFGNKGKIYQAKIRKRDIYLYTTARGEEEIVTNPNYLKEITIIT